MEIVDLEAKYGNFYAPDFEILIYDEEITKNIVTENHVEIVSVSVDNTLDGADTFTFTVNNAFDIIKSEVLWSDDLFKLGKRVKIKMGYANSTNDGLMTMIIGLITSTKINFPSSGAPQIEVSGFDLSYKLMTNKEARTYIDLTDTQITDEVAKYFHLDDLKEEPLVAVRDDSEIKYEQTVKQGTESDFEFLQRIAERNYFEFFVFRNTLYFRKPAADDSPIVTLEWGKSLVSFSPENSITEYVTEVEVKGRDTKNNKDIVANAESKLRKDEEKANAKSKLRKDEEKDMAYPTISFRIENVSATVENVEQAQRLAEATLKKLNEGLLKGSGESIGIPEILAGTNIKLKGLGRFSKDYYIEKTNHSISNSGYRTTFSVKDMSEIKNLGTESTGKEVDSTIPETETETETEESEIPYEFEGEET